jgi:nitroreductase
MNEEMLDLIRKRRTIRRFTAEDVTDEQIETLLEMAMCAPNRLNRQPWHFVIIRDQKVRQQLADILRVHPYLTGAPVAIAVCAAFEASPTWLMDVTAATENLLLGATALGLGGAWVGAPDTVLWNMVEEHLHDSLNIPLSVRIPILVAIGHPDQQFPPHGKRDRYNRTKVHYGKWGELKLG